MRLLFVVLSFLVLQATAQHIRIRHFRPHGHEEHLHFRPAINHCKAMLAYKNHPVRHRHVPHSADVVHNIPQPLNARPQSNDSTVKSATPVPEKPVNQVAEEVKKPEPVPAEPTATEKVKLNPRIAKYSAKVDSLGSGESMNLPAINFISNQDEFEVVNMDSFMEAAEFAKNGFLVLIEGHTDDKGSDDYNMKLSMKRVEKIKSLMVEMGVPEDNISVVGNGERIPLVPNTSEHNRMLNRRIEFKIFKM